MKSKKDLSKLRGLRSAAARELAREPRGDGRERRDPKKCSPVSPMLL